MTSNPTLDSSPSQQTFHEFSIPRLQPAAPKAAPANPQQTHQWSNTASTSAPPTTHTSMVQSSPTFVAPKPVLPKLSASTNEILARVNLSNGKGTTPGWEAAREQVLSQMLTSHNMPASAALLVSPNRGRGAKGTSPAARGTIRVENTDTKPIGGPTFTPSNTTPNGRPRGRGRGSSRARGGARGGKRKRAGSSEDGDVRPPPLHPHHSNLRRPPLTHPLNRTRPHQKPTPHIPPNRAPAAVFSNPHPLRPLFRTPTPLPHAVAADALAKRAFAEIV